MILDPPPGLIRLNHAVAELRKKMPEMDDVERTIANACAVGKIVAAYQTILGADPLEMNVWRMPHWRNFFETGMITLELPLLMEGGKPSPTGFTARCEREIFIFQDTFDLFVDGLMRPPLEGGEQFKKAPEKIIRNEVRAVYSDQANHQPNVNELARLVRPRLNSKGYDAADRRIREIGEEKEFIPFRRKPGRRK